jgi:hypothetical protein
MKKPLFALPLLLLLISCVSTGIFKQGSGGDRAVVMPSGGVSEIVVHKRVDLDDGSVVAVINAGQSVIVLKKSDSAALIKIDSGETGWIDIKFLKDSGQ